MRRISKPDNGLWIAVAIASVIGLLAIWDSGYARAAANGNLLPRELISQSIILPFAVLFGFLCSRLHAVTWKKLGIWLMGLTFVGLSLVKVPGIGKEINGAQRWIEIGMMTIQPAEFAKLGSIIFLAAMLASKVPWKQPRVKNWAENLDRVVVPKFFRALPLFVVCAAAVMIELEPDLATASVIVVTALAMLVVGKVSTKSLATVAIAFVLLAGFLVVNQSYRLNRIVNHGDRWSAQNVESIGYQTTQSEVAFSAGGMIGVGLGNGRAKHTLPAPTTDFVLTTVGEEFGLVGSLGILSLLGFITFRLMAAASRKEDMFGRLVLTGVGTWMGVQTVVNFMMVNGHLPPIGVPLPFLSSGGSSLLALWMAIGVCQAVICYPDPVEKVGVRSNRNSGKNTVEERMAVLR